jgi:hypothetical protein
MKEITEFIGKTYTYGGDMRWTIENEENCGVPVPKDIDESPTKVINQGNHD